MSDAIRRLTIPTPQSDRLDPAKRHPHPHFTPQMYHFNPADGQFHPKFIPQIDNSDLAMVNPTPQIPTFSLI